MKKKLRSGLKILLLFLSPLPAFCQDNIGDLFKSGPEDATKLVNAYINPLFKGMGVGLNSGWTNTAKTKSFLRFDLRITATAAFVPNSDKAYDVNTLGLKNMRPVDPFKSTGPTAFGSKQQGSEMEFYSNGYSTGKFRLPKGTGLGVVPSPQVQLTVGLLKNMDVSLRLVPKVNLGDDAGTISLFGIGTKLEVLPMLMGKKYTATPIDLAVAIGYSKLKYNIPLNINDEANSNQNVNIEMNGFSAEAIVSKKILFFTPFASIGYNTSKSDLKAIGSYKFDAPTPLDPNHQETYVDPISIKQTDVDGLKASLGFQLNLGFFRVYASYTQAKYSFANAGIGFGIGK
ncbi:MAG: DUF6588 family protein [Bacteroidota bacterium]